MKEGRSIDFRYLEINGISVSEVRDFTKEEISTFHVKTPEKGLKWFYLVWGTSCKWIQISNKVKSSEVVNGVRRLTDELLEELHRSTPGVSYNRSN